MRFTFLACVCLVLSCSGPDISPVQYNDSLVIEEVKVVEAADRLQEVFDTYVKEDMETVFSRFESQINNSLEKVENIGEYNGDVSFRNSTLDLLKTYKRLSEGQYKDAMELLSKPDSIYSPSDEARLELLYKQIDRVTEQAATNYRKAQDNFARQYKLQLNTPQEAKPAEESKSPL